MLKILALFVCLQTAFAAEEWQNYSVPFPIWDAVATKDGVWFATNGGVRYKDGSNDMVYTPAKGLEASTFYGVVYAPKGVFAISEYGLIARLADDFSRWKVLNRSFPAGNVRVTFDSDIRTSLFHQELLTKEAAGISATDEPQDVYLEVKFDAFLPEVVQDLIRVKGIRQHAFSKYSASRRFG